MAQTTLRLDDDLLEAIEEATDSEETRSEWIRDAIRMRLEKNERLIDRVETLEGRIEEIEEEIDKPLLERLFS